jgi:hypothetical protein
MHNQMELRRFAFYSVGTLPGTSNGLTETRPDTVVARVLDDQRPSVLYRKDAANETLHKTEQRLPLTTRWAILRKQFLRKV